MESGSDLIFHIGFLDSIYELSREIERGEWVRFGFSYLIFSDFIYELFREWVRFDAG